MKKTFKYFLKKMLTPDQIKTLVDMRDNIYRIIKSRRITLKTTLINLNDTNGASADLLCIAKRVVKQFKSNIIGAEFGVAYGGGVEAIGKIWKNRGIIYGFDTFESHPKYVAETDPECEFSINSHAAYCMDPWYKKYGKEKLSTEYIQSVLDSQGLSNVKLVKGLVCSGTNIDYMPYLDYVTLDLDFPISMRQAYSLVKDKMTKGSYLCLHDVIPRGHINGLFELYQEIKNENLFQVVIENYSSYLVVLKRTSAGAKIRNVFSR